jgi:hypothetical protein
MDFEVQEYTLCDGYINNWSYTDDKGETVKSTFETREAANHALINFIDDCLDEVRDGNMPDAPEYNDFRIVEVQL